MGNLLPGLLNDTPRTGPASVHSRVRTNSGFALVDSTSLSDGFSAIAELCGRWSGAYVPLLPVLPTSATPPEPWSNLIEASLPDFIASRGKVEPPPEGDANERVTRWTERPVLADTLTVLAHLPNENQKAKVRVADGFDLNEPWAVAYSAIWGRSPVEPNAESRQWAQLVDDFHFSNVVEVDASRPSKPGPVDLLESLWSNDLTASRLSCIELGTTSAPVGGSFETPPLLPLSFDRAREIGPNIVVIYEPGSVADLCLLWHLRAVHGLRRGLPLGVPASEDVGAALEYWVRNARFLWGFRRNPISLVSMSVPRSQLDQYVQRGNGTIQIVEVADVLQPNFGCGHDRAEVVFFDEGVATVIAPTSVGRIELGAQASSDIGISLNLVVAPDDDLVPPSRTHAVDRFTGSYRQYGALVSIGGGPLIPTRDIVWPSGWTILSAALRDLKLRGEPSTPGRVAATLLDRTYTDQGMLGFLHSGVNDLLATLVARHGLNWFKEKITQLSQQVTTSLATFQDQHEDLPALLDEVKSSVDHIVASSTSDELHQITFDSVRTVLRSRRAAEAWLAWAERTGIIVRGVTAACPECRLKTWYPVGDLNVALVCRGCGADIKNPFGFDQIKFRYRASELLLQIYKDDSLVHALAHRYLWSVFGPIGRGFGPIYGGYPGVDVYETVTGSKLAEVDNVFVMVDGRLAVGECKTRAGGLTSSELKKLGDVARRLDASWTFVATLDRAERCGDIWRRSPTDESIPHFSFTAEHLLDVQPRAVLANDPLGWRETFVGRNMDEVSPEARNREVAGRFEQWLDSRPLHVPYWRSQDG